MNPIDEWVKEAEQLSLFFSFRSYHDIYLFRIFLNEFKRFFWLVIIRIFNAGWVNYIDDFCNHVGYPWLAIYLAENQVKNSDLNLEFKIGSPCCLTKYKNQNYHKNAFRQFAENHLKSSVLSLCLLKR